MNNYISVSSVCDELNKAVMCVESSTIVIYDDLNTFDYLFIVGVSPVINVFISREFYNLEKLYHNTTEEDISALITED